MYDFDGPFPDLQGNNVRMSNPPALAALARREGLSLRQLAYRFASARGHWLLKGTSSQVVDQLEFWFRNEAADGFIFLPQVMPGSLDDLVDLIIPELQRRGLFRTEYQGTTLRDRLGVKRPVNRYAGG